MKLCYILPSIFPLWNRLRHNKGLMYKLFNILNMTSHAKSINHLTVAVIFKVLIF